MHFMPDTEDEDSAAETFWPEGYKQVIRDTVSAWVRTQLNGGSNFQDIYQKQYSERYSNQEEFLNKLSDMVAIGAENGADDAFDEIVEAFLSEAALPAMRKYAHYTSPEALSDPIKEQLRQVIIDEYSQDNIYCYAYQVGYQSKISTFDQYINMIADLVITGAINGADDMLGAIYRTFYDHGPLLPARRYPRRLKMW